MRRKAVKFVFLAFAFLVLTAFASVSTAKTIYVPDDYLTIQSAVNAASPGDTIIVRDGLYKEHVIVNKQLTIKSERGHVNCVVNGGGSDVFALYADGIRIEGFTITGGRHGIFINSNNNSISNNNISSNNYGISLYESNDNIIYLNNFINNTYHAFSLNSTNIWNSKEPIKYTYRGSEFTNYMGNYWDDYNGSDANGDGIGETPYSIGSDKDNYPLMRPFEYYFVPELTVSVSTDKYEYTAGDLMLINITFENPKDEGKSVKFLWILDIPDYNLSFIVINNKSLLLPPEFKKTFVIPWRLPKLRASFNASWYVAFYDGIISEDTADWRYIGAKKKRGGEREIARDIAELREIERSALQSAKLIKSEG